MPRDSVVESTNAEYITHRAITSGLINESVEKSKLHIT